MSNLFFYHREKWWESWVSDIFSFGTILFSMWFNYNYLGNSRILGFLLLVFLLFMLMGRSGTKTFKTRKEIIDYLNRLDELEKIEKGEK